jgi:hypothetical protein
MHGVGLSLVVSEWLPADNSRLQILDRVSGGPYDPYACAASLYLSLVGKDLSMNDSRSRPRLLLPQLILTGEA